MKSSTSINGIASLNRVEFSNNGALDSLTGAPAPKVFFENLAREIAKSKRKFQPISIVMVQVLPDFSLLPNKVLVETSNTRKKNVQNKEDMNPRGSAYEKELILVGRCLKSNMRAGDFYSRIADNGFWICLQGDAADAQKAVARFGLKISEAKNLENRKQGKIPAASHPLKENDSIDCNQIAEFAISEWDGKSNDVEWIHEIDLRYFDHREAEPK